MPDAPPARVLGPSDSVDDTLTECVWAGISPCSEYTRDYGMDLQAGTPVLVRATDDQGQAITLQVQWHGQIVADGASEYGSYRGSSTDRGILFVPPLTGRYVIHVETPATQINIASREGVAPAVE